MDGKTGKYLTAVEIVLRKAELPEARLNLVPFLHEVTAFVDFPEEQADGNVFGDVALNARELRGILINPDISMHSGENGSEARGRFEGRIRRHLVFGQDAIPARLSCDKGEEKSVARRVDEIVAFLFLLRIFLHGIALRAIVVDDQRE